MKNQTFTIIPLLIAIFSCNHTHGQLQRERINSFTVDSQLINDKLFILVEHNGGMRERAIADVVHKRTNDPEVKELAKVFREGHQLGIDRLRTIASKLKITLSHELSPDDQLQVNVIQSLSSDEIGRFFLIRHRAMHAWDITVFTDYLNFAVDDELRKYIRETLPPLILHGQQVVQLSNARGIKGSFFATGN